MNIVTEWACVCVHAYETPVAGFTGLIYKVELSVTARDADYVAPAVVEGEPAVEELTCTLHETRDIPLPEDPTKYVPVDQVTKAQALEWAQATMGPDLIANFEDRAKAVFGPVSRSFVPAN